MDEEKNINEENIFDEETGVNENIDDVEEATGKEEQTNEEVSVNEDAEENAETEEATEEDASEADTEHDEILDMIEKNKKDSEPVPASKKTTIVLLGIIVVLIAVIVVFSVIFIKKYLEEKDAAKSGNTGDTTIENLIPDADGDTDISSQPIPTPVEFNVTAELGQYKGIEVDYVEREITEEDIELEIEYMLESSAEPVEVTDRPVRNGDVVNIDYAGYMDDVQFEGGTDTDYDLEIGSQSFIDGFESGLIGASVGDVVDLNIAFPDPYPNNPDLSGKPVLFVVTVNSITEYVTPELTDEFVSENTEYETVEEYRAGLREELEASAAEEAQAEAETAVFETLIANTVFGGEIDDEIAFYTQRYIDYYDQMASSYYGVDGATLFSYMYGISADEYHDMLASESENLVKYQYALDEIAKAEGMTVSDEEYEAEFEDIFYYQYGYTNKEEVLADISQEEVDKMVNESALRRKAERFVLDNAIINH